MGAYYYLAAQLPYLNYGQGAPMSSDAFKALARDAMSSSDAAVLDYCTLDPDPSDHNPSGHDPSDYNPKEAPKSGISYAKPVRHVPSAFINRWREWERTLRLNLAKSRMQKLKREGGTADAPEHPADAAGAAKTAMAIESPLEAEIFLDKARWDAIEHFQGINNFSVNAMYAYLLKLLLMERRSAFNTEDGFTEYKRLYTAILDLQTIGVAK